jgi:hypothetical protein
MAAMGNYNLKSSTIAAAALEASHAEVRVAFASVS